MPVTTHARPLIAVLALTGCLLAGCTATPGTTSTPSGQDTRTEVQPSDPRSSAELSLLTTVAETCAPSGSTELTTSDGGMLLHVTVTPGTPAASADCVIRTLEAPQTSAALLRGEIDGDHGELGRWDSNPQLSTGWVTGGDGVVVTIQLAGAQ
jgi:hypothetical protein